MTFIVRETANNTFMVGMSELLFSDVMRGGSYNVLAARALGLSYPDYLKMCRAKFNGMLCGREGYSYCVFKNKEDCKRLCIMLNKEWTQIEKVIRERYNG